jgi:hypothetical protein
MAEHRLWLHPQSYMPASYYAAPQGRRCHLFVKKMRRAGQTLICGRLTAPPDDSDQRAPAQNVSATVSPGAQGAVPGTLRSSTMRFHASELIRDDDGSYGTS